MQERVSQQGPPIRVFYLGSGEAGVPVLARLLEAPDIEIVGVATQPDRPAGRRQRPQPTPIAGFAARRGLPLERPESVNRPAFLDLLRGCSPELVVVLSFGQILKRELLDMPRFGCLNVHFSLLPRHRGASPVSAAILAGDAETGISFMRMDEGLDTGPVYCRVRLGLRGTETAGELEERLAALAAEHVCACIRKVCRGGLGPEPQPEEGATYAPRIRKQDAALDWSEPAERIERCVRAYHPWPKAWFVVDVRGRRRRLQLTRAAVCPSAVAGRHPPGSTLEAGPGGWIVACGHGALRLLEVVPEGRRPMDVRAYLRGNRIAVGDVLPAAVEEEKPEKQL